MSSGYQQYSGNPYGQAEAGYGGSNPYGGTQGGYGASNPYGAEVRPVASHTARINHSDNSSQMPQDQLAAPALAHGDSNYSQASQYSQPNAPPAHPGAAPLSQQEFLTRIDGAKTKINQLSSSIQSIASIHQRMLGSPDSSSSAQLESIVADTQNRNGQIKEDIKALERDAAREPNNTFKKTQVETLKRTFRKQLEDFQKEESDYAKRYREAIKRQYRIVNPDATQQEVDEAANANWGDEGVFQTAVSEQPQAEKCACH